MRKTKAVMRGLSASRDMVVRSAALRWLCAREIVANQLRPRGMHPEVKAAFAAALKGPELSRWERLQRLLRPSPRAVLRPELQRGTPVTTREYFRGKHGELRRRELPLARRNGLFTGRFEAA